MLRQKLDSVTDFFELMHIGARAKLDFAIRAVENGANVVIGHARYHIADLMSGDAPCTRLGVGLEAGR